MAGAGGGAGVGNFPYCQRSKELIMELKRSDWIPNYNGDSVRQVIEEINALYQQIKDVLPEDKQVQDAEIACPLMVYHHSIVRNKRCLLAYLKFRMEKLVELRWQTGSVVPSELKPKLSESEVEFYNGYDQLIGEYMQAVDLNLTADMQPPKHLYIEVRVLRDCGEILTESGAVVLEKNTTHYLRRADVEHLIRQNFLEQIGS